MSKRQDLRDLVAALPAGVTVHPGSRLASITTFQIGGTARIRMDCPSPRDLPAVLAALRAGGWPWVLLGEGSNVLVSDEGFPGAVLRFQSRDLDARTEGGILDVNAAAPLDELVRTTVDRGRAGLVACSGIPGTIAGAIVGNAGAWGRQIADVLTEVQCLQPGGGVSWRPAEDLGFTYRSSRLKASGDIVLRGRFRLREGEREALRAERQGILEARARKHPDWRREPCVGSIFRNIEPTSAAGRRQAAGWFLEQVGAKELRVGGAAVYPKHANIIINRGGATARDVMELLSILHQRVLDRFGLNLEREIRLLGPFPGRAGTGAGFH